MYTVVVADDEEELRHAIVTRVDWRSAGFEVVGEAENGIEALELVERLEPDLVITDIKMPHLSGLDLAERIRAVRPATQIVILSGYDSFTYAQRAIKYNIISYLLKPISAEELSEELIKIHGVMEKRFDEIRGGSIKDEADVLRQLSLTQFLLPLLLGSTEDSSSEGVLEKNAERLGIVGTESKPRFCVMVFKFKNSGGEYCTGEEHIGFINAVLGKYMRSESFFVNGTIVTLAIFDAGDNVGFSNRMELPLREIYQSAIRLFSQKCTIGVSREIDRLSMCSNAYFEAVTARRYTSDETGDVRFIEDQERGSDSEFEYVEKSVFTLEQLLKVGQNEKLEDFLKELYQENNKKNFDYLVIQILATVYRTVSAVSDKEALSELVNSNPIYSKAAFYDSDSNIQSDIMNLCRNARDIISRYQKQHTEVICDKVIEIIDSEYSNEQLSLTDVSSRLNVSPNYLSVLIKKTKKANFVSLVTERRMKAAYDMLVCSSMKILEIAERCGYSDQHYFSYCFKRYYGVSPNKMRERAREKDE